MDTLIWLVRVVVGGFVAAAFLSFFFFWGALSGAASLCDELGRPRTGAFIDRVSSLMTLHIPLIIVLLILRILVGG